MIKCAIFDLDGTIVDSMPYWETAATKFINCLGLKEHENLCERFLSLNLPEGCEYIIKDYNLNLSLEEVMKGIDDIMLDNYMNYVTIKPNFIKVLNLFKKYNIKMAIASSTDRHLIVKILEKLDLSKYFEYIITSTEIGKNKKHPDIYLDCSKHFNVLPKETMIFEDLPYGVIATKPLGFFTVGLFDKTSLIHQEALKNASKLYFEEITDKELTILEKILRDKSLK